jgi:hypothetical protein
LSVAVIAMVTALAPQSNVTTPPLVIAALSAANEQLPAVPVPTTVVGFETSAGCPSAGTPPRHAPSGLPAPHEPPPLEPPAPVEVPPVVAPLVVLLEVTELLVAPLDPAWPAGFETVPEHAVASAIVPSATTILMDRPPAIDANKLRRLSPIA